MVTQTVPGSRSAAVGLWVGVGSRDESDADAGAAHFLEHLLFKATPTRTASSLAIEMDGIGGEHNAFTGREHTCFYTHVLDHDLPLAVEVVTDVVLRGCCADGDVDVERDVVLEELAIRDDDPEDLVAESAAEAILGAIPVSRPVIGDEATIRAMTGARLRDFHRRYYTPQRMVLSVAGNIDHERVLALAGDALGPLPGDAAPFPVRRGAPAPSSAGPAPSLRVTTRPGEQSHLVAGVASYGRFHPDRWALSLLNTAIGGGMSSRLFQQVREERGLAYSVYSAVETLADTGVFTVYAGCSPDRLGEAAALLRSILDEVRQHGIADAELIRAKGALRGGLVLGLEDTHARMIRIGRSEMNYGNQRSLTQTLEAIDAVTLEDCNRVARQLLARPFGGAVVGPHTARRVPAAVRDWLGR